MHTDQTSLWVSVHWVVSVSGEVWLHVSVSAVLR